MGRASDPHEVREERRDAASRRAVTKLLTKVGERVEYIDHCIDDPTDGETFIQSLYFKVQGSSDGEMLVIVKAQVGGAAIVSFHAADSLVECLTGLANRLANGSLKWREDTPYGTK